MVRCSSECIVVVATDILLAETDLVVEQAGTILEELALDVNCALLTDVVVLVLRC